MSSTTVGAPSGITLTRRVEPLRFKLLAAGIAGATILVIGAGLAATTDPVSGWLLLAWVVLAAAASFVAVSTGDGASLSMDLPLLLATAVVYEPAICGLIAIAGATDSREWHRSISGWLAIYNRSQVALSVMAASLVFHGVHGVVGAWPWAAIAAIVALCVDCLVNYSFVALALSLRQSRSFLSALMTMRFGEPRVFVPTYLSFGFLGILIAESYVSLGFLGVVSFFAPILLARHAFAHRKEIERFAKSLTLRAMALEELDKRVVKERRDERLILAADIHDEVLPPLFKVHLMGEVIRRDLDSGRLLDLDDDLPQLLEATRLAQDAMRRVLHNVRSLPTGDEGLRTTLESLVKSVEADCEARLEVEVDDVKVSSVMQLLLYQVAREALHNAVKHAHASVLQVVLRGEVDAIRLVVADNGDGFRVESVDRSAHFGLQLLAERVGAANGVLQVASEPGVGTRVAVMLPRTPRTDHAKQKEPDS